MKDMLEVKLDQKTNKYIITALSKDKSDQYIIVCENEYEAKSLCTQITMGMVPSPLDNPLKYKSAGIHPDGEIKIYKIK